jgi:hypothetical protein
MVGRAELSGQVSRDTLFYSCYSIVRLNHPCSFLPNRPQLSLGVPRIWTSPSQRGQGIAQCLLDRTLEHYNARATQHSRANEAVGDRSKVDLDPAAAALCRQHVGQIGSEYGWLVYSA